MKAIKANKVYTISETDKDKYFAQGFDVVDDKGNVEHSPASTVAYAEYEKVVAENKKLKAEIAKLKTKKGEA